MFDKIFGKINKEKEIDTVYTAVRYDREDDYKKYIDSVDINCLRTNGKGNLLQAAIACKHFKYVKDLLERGINVNNKDEKGETVLHYFGQVGIKDVELAEELISHGADLNIKDKFGNNPLWYAVFYARGDYGLVRYFIGKGADPLNKNSSGWSALDKAEQLEDEVLIKILTKSEGK